MVAVSFPWGFLNQSQPPTQANPAATAFQFSTGIGTISGEPKEKFSGDAARQSFKRFSGWDAKWLPANTTAWRYEESYGYDTLYWLYVFMSDGKVLGVRTDEYIDMTHMRPY